MEPHRERIVFDCAMGTPFGIAAGQQQSEIRGLMRVAGKLASGQVGNFGEHNTTQFEAPLRCAVELSGLQRIRHALLASQIFTLV
jgi:hypothetical protein